MIKAAIKRKGVRNEDARERCLEVYKEEKRKLKKCIFPSKKEV